MDGDAELLYAEWLAERPLRVREVAKNFKPWLEYQFKNSKRLCYIYSFEDPHDGSAVTLKVIQPDMFISDLGDKVFGVRPEDIELADEHCVRPLGWVMASLPENEDG